MANSRRRIKMGLAPLDIRSLREGSQIPVEASCPCTSLRGAGAMSGDYTAGACSDTDACLKISL